jgi:hypothetical protein
MAGLQTPVRVTAVSTNTSTEGVAISIPYTGGDIAAPIVGMVPGTPGNANNEIEVDLNITAGTGTTGISVKCRRGNGVAGTQVGTTRNFPLAAGATDDRTFKFQDPNAPTQCGYSITVTQTGAPSAAGTINEGVAQVSQYI